MADIGSLVVKLAAETAEFQADLGKSARLLDKHANEMKASLQSVANVAKSAFAIAVGVTLRLLLHYKGCPSKAARVLKRCLDFRQWPPFRTPRSKTLAEV